MFLTFICLIAMVVSITASTKILNQRSKVLLPTGLSKIVESDAQFLADRIEKRVVTVDGKRIDSSFVKLEKNLSASSNKGEKKQVPFLSGLFNAQSTFSSRKAPLVLLHGFDSSCLEFRRLAPLLNYERDVYVVDILGWGFIDHSVVEDFTPAAKMAHLKAFVRDVVGQRVVVVGTSLGGALAITLAVEEPKLVEQVNSFD